MRPRSPRYATRSNGAISSSSARGEFYTMPRERVNRLEEAGHNHNQWEEDKIKQRDFFDDGTMTYFWRRHTITVLAVFSCVLFYVAVLEPSRDDVQFNTKRGIFAGIMAFLCVSVTQTPDGPFRRPHPALWRLVLCLSIVYELFLIFLLFQTADQARLLLTHFDDTLGKPLPEKDYGGNCFLYDTAVPDNPFHNIWDKIDCFVPCHFFGWWLKTLILRDYWLCTVLSIMFELLEYTLEHQLPNFSECWWDHWIMDALVCNGLGIWCGMLTVKYLSIKHYHWHGLWSIHSYTGKLRRLAAQFSPYMWMDFDWRPTLNFKRWIMMLNTIVFFSIAELNTFYLKFVLWLPPSHYINLLRLILFLFMGAVAMREQYQYIDDMSAAEPGRQSWIVASIIVSELLIVLKFGWDTVSQPLPRHVTIFWLVAIATLIVWTFYEFYVKRHLHRVSRTIKPEAEIDSTDDYSDGPDVHDLVMDEIDLRNERIIDKNKNEEKNVETRRRSARKKYYH